MIATFDFISGVDLPGELTAPPDDVGEPEPLDCGRCGRPASPDFAGLCMHCADRLAYGIGRYVGCGLGLALVAALGGDFGDSTAALTHLTDCAACRAFFGGLAELVRVAEMEAPQTASLAATV